MKTKGFLLLPLYLCFFFLYANGQKKDNAAATKEAAPSAEHELNIYNYAMQYGDYQAAKNAVFALIEKHPDNASYLDTLTRLYSVIGTNDQTIMAGTACLKKDTSDNKVIELVAIANSALDRHEEALELYKRLVVRTKSPFFGYMVALNEYQLNRYDQSAQTLEGVIKDTASEKRYISITMNSNRSQTVPLKAAAHNLLGVSQLASKMKDKAKDNFEAALKIYPQFVLAQENVDMIKKQKEGDADTKPK